MAKKKSAAKKRTRKTKTISKATKVSTPVHAWRICPYGEHWVRTHPMHFPPSKTHPEGGITTRHEHCARNPSGKDQLYPDEIREISQEHFSNLKNKPCSLSLGFENGSKYDDLIAGWVQYWNEILKPIELLDANLVKALIASESGFNPDSLADKRKPNSARGLMQITNDSRKILGDDSGEIKDHYISTTRNDLNDPAVNICAGVRWLFHKRELLSRKLERSASWIETIDNYKGNARTTKTRAKEIMDIFNRRYETLKKCRKT